MAAQQQQMLGLLQNQQTAAIPQWLDKKLFDDTPTPEGKLRLHKVLQWLHGISRGGSSLGINVEGNDPGAGGGGNPTIQAQHTDRNTASFQSMLSTIDPGSILYNTCSTAPFTKGQHIFDYLHVDGVVYIRPLDSVAQEHIRKVQNYNYLDLPPSQQNAEQCLHFKTLITGHNPLLHPNMNINRTGMITIYCNGLHPEGKVVALEMKDDLTLAAQKGCCFPTNWPVGHPTAGVAHPNAGALSLDLLAIYVHKQFNTKLNAGLFRLKAQPAVNMVSELPVPQMDTGTDKFVSINDAVQAGCDNFNDYIYYVMNKPAPTSRLRTCINCGGINHMKDVCPTPPGTVSENVLRSIRYPLGVNPWLFNGKGKGKGKGHGKGSRGRGSGRGRGIMAAWQYFDEPMPETVTEPLTETTTPPDDTTTPSEPEQVPETWDDYDGWNSWVTPE